MVICRPIMTVQFHYFINQPFIEKRIPYHQGKETALNKPKQGQRKSIKVSLRIW